MKNINKFFAFLMTVGLVFNQSGIIPEAKLDSFAHEHGFDLDTSEYKNIGHSSKAIYNALYYYNKRYCKVGQTETYVIFATDRVKPSGYPQKNIAMFHHVIEPYGLKENNTFYGGSDYLNVVVDLRDRLNVAKIQKSLPDNVADNSKSYSVGVSASTKGAFGISASESIVSKDINIVNHSRHKYYDVTYDYGKPSRWERMKDKGYLSGITEQKGSIAYYTNGAKFTFPIKITSSFDVYTGTNVHYGSERVSESVSYNLKT